MNVTLLGDVPDQYSHKADERAAQLRGRSMATAMTYDTHFLPEIDGFVPLSFVSTRENRFNFENQRDGFEIGDQMDADDTYGNAQLRLNEPYDQQMTLTFLHLLQVPAVSDEKIVIPFNLRERHLQYGGIYVSSERAPTKPAKRKVDISYDYGEDSDTEDSLVNIQRTNLRKKVRVMNEKVGEELFQELRFVPQPVLEKSHGSKRPFEVKPQEVKPQEVKLLPKEPVLHLQGLKTDTNAAANAPLAPVRMTHIIRQTPFVEPAYTNCECILEISPFEANQLLHMLDLHAAHLIDPPNPFLQAFIDKAQQFVLGEVLLDFKLYLYARVHGCRYGEKSLPLETRKEFCLVAHRVLQKTVDPFPGGLANPLLGNATSIAHSITNQASKFVAALNLSLPEAKVQTAVDRASYFAGGFRNERYKHKLLTFDVNHVILKRLLEDD
ncbi:hypothetical protein BABINDRAFT_152137 [Babjeviella inositovora NRRL Y-12698]|uniref:Uncharacterized protein n=1 Tax=Babjeviella inositovora NRRL Y-12698 TaxID=984486 RepID=A0A1E3QLX4_9ASCO|nr:uncharacterized protein BABINDRAFT_152137 [Babjeviella inositovora NRRL Y-12698]ODQ78696.1 hypothetical protein BABINDRAFT_152137 [Babjeviella inositovora NRRL Y-12698]